MICPQVDAAAYRSDLRTRASPEPRVFARWLDPGVGNDPCQGTQLPSAIWAQVGLLIALTCALSVFLHEPAVVKDELTWWSSPGGHQTSARLERSTLGRQFGRIVGDPARTLSSLNRAIEPPTRVDIEAGDAGE